MRFLIFVGVTLGALFLPGALLAHGTSEPGPHRGEIRMPGAFHVEALAVDGRLRVYLLNMQFESPQIANSSVKARIKQGGVTVDLQCTEAADAKAFRCSLPSGANLDQGTLIIDASRAGLPADPARYELPLKWSDQKSEED
jgi:hypothetical protein